MWGCRKFAYEATNQILLIHAMQSQTKACIAKLSYEVSALLVYYAALSGNSLPTFWDNILIPSSRVKKSKKRTEIKWS